MTFIDKTVRNVTFSTVRFSANMNSSYMEILCSKNNEMHHFCLHIRQILQEQCAKVSLIYYSERESASFKTRGINVIKETITMN